MARAAANSTYGRGAVYGSLAYDFNHPELYAGEEYSAPQREQETKAKPREQTRVRTRARAQHAVHTKQGVAPVALAGALVAAFLLVTAITAQVRLISTSGDSVALQNQLAELEETQAKLRIRYESAFNLSEIEDYATTRLGMQKPNAAQINFIDTSASDKAVVVGNGGGDGIVDRVADFVSGFGAYFR